MIYDGKQASLLLQEQLRNRVTLLSTPPTLAVFSVSSNPSIESFIKIKRKCAESIGVIVQEFSFPESMNEDDFIQEVQKGIDTSSCDALIIQLPLPSSYNTKKVLDAIPKELDADVLGKDAWGSFIDNNYPIPPVVGAVAHILQDTAIDITNKKVTVIGQGILVGLPVTEWFKHQGIELVIVDINTDEVTRLNIYKESDIVVSGIGKPHHLKKEFFKQGVILIDAGTSEQAGVLAGDIDPLCSEIASAITPVPGGVGPLTVAYLFHNVITIAEEKK